MKRSLLLSIIAMSVVTAPAVAASPTANGYDETGAAEVLGAGPEVLGATAVRPADDDAAAPVAQAASPESAPVAVAAPTATREADSGSLPFTGLDLGIIALGAVALLAAGFALRRVSHQPQV